MRTHSISNRRRHRLCCDMPCVRPASPPCVARTIHFYGKRYPFAGFQSNSAAIANNRGLFPHAAKAFGTQTQCDWPCQRLDARNSFDQPFGICRRRANTPISKYRCMIRECPCTQCPIWFERWLEWELKQCRAKTKHAVYVFIIVTNLHSTYR